jgi:thiamine biosynthesis lipoprotein
MHTLRFEAIGTLWQIDHTASADYARGIRDIIDQYSAVYSRFQSTSLISQLSSRAGTIELPGHSADLFSLYRTLYELTDGAVTPLIGDIMVAAGYDARYSLKVGELRRAPDWDKAIEYDEQTLSLTAMKPTVIDIGAAGKGQLVDLIARFLDDQDGDVYSIDASGDIRVSGITPPEEIGLEHPLDPTKAIGIIRLSDGSICGSAGNRRAWQGIHHIINPRTLQPVDDIIATWAIAKSCMVADGLATALFFAKPEALTSHFQFDYVVMRKDGTVRYSAGLPGELFS